MTDDVLEKYIKYYIEAQKAPIITFAWQGGEPLLAGIDFYKKAIEFQRIYAGKRQIENVIQTNGVLLNEDWCKFLKENNFLVGISIDGPEEIHNYYRKYKSDKPTFKEVMYSIDLLHKYNIPFNTLTVVQKHNSKFPLEIYSFLKDIGSRYLQFIPVVERYSEIEARLVLPDSRNGGEVTEWSVIPAAYGNFLIKIFDEWVRADVGKVFVQTFDATLANWLGMHPGVCVFNSTCGDALVMEHNGDVYACDHFVFSEHLRGNIITNPLAGMVNSNSQRKFGVSKAQNLPNYCINCTYRFTCNGECPKYRFEKTPEGEPGLSYLCKAYKMFFEHVHPYMQYMSDKIKLKQPPSDVMEWAKSNEDV
jgi:uncharacterized protein